MQAVWVSWKKHPMTDTLKSICEQCAHLRDPRLEFLPQESQRHKEIILRDLRELIAAALNEHERSVLLLAGGLFEALLYSFIQGQIEYISERRGIEFTFREGHDLGNFISIFNKWFSETLKIPDTVVRYRNTIHINCELNSDEEVCSRGARDLLRQLDLLLGALEGYSLV
jgi:hypothetical protein